MMFCNQAPVWRTPHVLVALALTVLAFLVFLLAGGEAQQWEKCVVVVGVVVVSGGRTAPASGCGRTATQLEPCACAA